MINKLEAVITLSAFLVTRTCLVLRSGFGQRRKLRRMTMRKKTKKKKMTRKKNWRLVVQ